MMAVSHARPAKRPSTALQRQQACDAILHLVQVTIGARTGKATAADVLIARRKAAGAVETCNHISAAKFVASWIRSDMISEARLIEYAAAHVRVGSCACGDVHANVWAEWLQTDGAPGQLGKKCQRCGVVVWVAYSGRVA